MQFLSPPSAATCVLLACVSGTSPVLAEQVKVAFIGDQGVSPAAQQVLELIRDEGADLLLIQGDLGYDPNSAGLWIENMDNILGRDFPVLMVVGNHENYEWPAYLQWQKDKLARLDSIQCEGDISVKAYCTYKNIGVVQVAPGITEVEGINGNDNYAQYITDKLESDNSTWRICSWHKNMHDMQAGAKGDATGWAVYQSCLAQGGLVMTGHEHSYSRTHLMSNFEAKTVIHKNNDMEIGPHSSLAFVSGLGGREIRPQLHGGDWFASIHTATQNANFGSLFCTFDNDQADCYLKDVAGLVPDAFSLTSKLEHAVSEGTDSSTVVVEEALVEDSQFQTDAAQLEFEQQAESEATGDETAAEQTAIDELAAVGEEQVQPEAQAEAQTEAQAAEDSTTVQVEAEEQLENLVLASAATTEQSTQSTDADDTLQQQEEQQQQSAGLDDSINPNLNDSMSAGTTNDVPTTVITGDPPPPVDAVTTVIDNENAASNSSTSGGGIVHWLTLVSLLSLAVMRKRLCSST